MKGGVATLWRVEKERRNSHRRRRQHKKKTRKLNYYTHRVDEDIRNLIKRRETLPEKIRAIINFTEEPVVFLEVVRRLIRYLLHAIKVGTSSTKVLNKVDTVIVILARSFEKFRLEHKDYNNNENTNNEKNRNRSTNDVYDYLNEQYNYISDIIRSNDEMRQGMLAEELRFALTDALESIIATKDTNLEDLAGLFGKGFGL